MAWQTTLDISDLLQQYDEGYLTVKGVARHIASRLEENKFASDSVVQDIIMRLLEVDDDADEFDEILDDLYDFGDVRFRIWVKSLRQETTMAHEEWMKRQRAMKPIVTLDRLCKDMGVDTVEDFMEFVMRNDETYSWAYKYAIEEEGKTEEEAEEYALKAESDSLSEASDKYMDAVMSVARELYAEHELELTEDHKDCLKFHVSPTKRDKRGRLDWRSSLECIRQTINGVGYFEFDSVDCLIGSGPYTVRSAVMEHLHWIPSWVEVYEGGKAKSMVERRLRY